MIVADLTPRFPAPVRQRGAAYFASGAVDIRRKSPDELWAYVVGTREYVTGLTLDGACLTLSCECPYFLSDGPCKHLWATVLAADQAGALAAMPSFTKLRLDPDQGGEVDEGRQRAVITSPPLLAVPAYRRASPARP